MQVSAPLLAIRVAQFENPVYVEDRPSLNKKEKKMILKEAKKAADEVSDMGYKVYSSVFNKTYTEMYDTLIKHFLKIREIENESISQGDSRSKTIEKSSEYAKSVAKQYQPSETPSKK